jgi:hypothetical protein
MLKTMLTQTASSNPMDNISGHLSNPQAGNSDADDNGPSQQDVYVAKDGFQGSLHSCTWRLQQGGVLSFVKWRFEPCPSDFRADWTPYLSHRHLGEQSKIAMQSSPEAGSMATQLQTAQKDSGGILSKLKKLLRG